jgi:hypothetical protein
MTFPSISQSVRDPGLNKVNPATKIPIMSGIATGGSQAVNTRGSIADLADVRSLIGYGPLAEDVALALSKRGGPIYFIRHDPDDVSKALSSAVLTPPGSGSPPAVTVSGTPNDRFYLRVEVVVGGARGTATFKYSLDAWDSDIAPATQSQVRATAATYVMVGSGLTLEFPTGTYVAGHVYTLECVPQQVTTTDLADVATLLAADTAINFFIWMLSGDQSDSVTGAAIASALSGHLTTLTQSFRYVRGYLDVGSGDAKADVETAAASWTSARISAHYGFEYRPSQIPFEGFSTRKTSCVSTHGIRRMTVPISNDLARTSDGPDDGVLAIDFDGFQDQALDAVKISTMRTWVGMAGFYIANGKLKSAFGSDFTDTQHGYVMDIACRTTFEAQHPFVADSLRTIGPDLATESRPAGAIDERDAKEIETAVNNALADQLLRPLNARGNPGHVSNVVYAVDLGVNLVTTEEIVSTVLIRPLGYSKVISTTLAFSLNI